MKHFLEILKMSSVQWRPLFSEPQHIEPLWYVHASMNWVIIGSGICLVPHRCQVINAELLYIDPWLIEISFNGICVNKSLFSEERASKMCSVKLTILCYNISIWEPWALEVFAYFTMGGTFYVKSLTDFTVNKSILYKGHVLHSDL